MNVTDESRKYIFIEGPLIPNTFRTKLNAKEALVVTLPVSKPYKLR